MTDHTYMGWTIRNVGASWYTYAPGEPLDIKHGGHHSSRREAREYVRAWRNACECAMRQPSAAILQGEAGRP